MYQTKTYTRMNILILPGDIVHELRRFLYIYGINEYRVDKIVNREHQIETHLTLFEEKYNRRFYDMIWKSIQKHFSLSDVRVSVSNEYSGCVTAVNTRVCKL